MVRRSAGPPDEPPRVAETWHEGRYLFFWAQDERTARQKVAIRFPEAQGFQIVEMKRHDGDLGEPPTLSSGTGAGSHANDADTAPPPEPAA